MKKQIFILIALLSLSTPSRSQTITTVAGGGVGDGDPATIAEVNDARGIAVDRNGNVYIADLLNNRVRMISAASGIINTIAGTGTLGYSGDGGPATNAELNYPMGVAVDTNGNVYIADVYNYRIRKVNSSGIISTFAGTGTLGFSGDGGPASTAAINNAVGLAVNGIGDIYIADQYNERIRKVNSSGIITTFAGNGTLGYSGDGGPATASMLNDPTGIAFDAAGNTYIADCFNQVIRKVNSTGIISTLAGNDTLGITGDGGPATAAELHYPWAVAVDGGGNVYIADSHNERIRVVNSSGIIRAFAGTGSYGYSGDGGPATNAKITYPFGVAFNATGDLFFTDCDNYCVRKVNTSGTISTITGTGTQYYCGDGGAATTATLGNPVSVAVDGVGNVYIGDADNNRIRKISVAGIITTYAGTDSGGFTGDGGPATAARLYNPRGFAIDKRGSLYFSDAGHIRVINSSGIIKSIAGVGASSTYSGDGGPATAATLNNAWGVAVDSIGNVYVADAGNHRVRVIDTNGIINNFTGSGAICYCGDGGPATDAGLYFPTGVAVDGRGNVYISDPNNFVVRVVNASGIINTFAGNGIPAYIGDGGPATEAELDNCYGVSYGGNGIVYIADDGNSVIRKVDSNGIITTIAGNGTTGYNGDGELATAAELNYPSCAVGDGSGNLYISDNANSRIRKVTDNSHHIITTVSNVISASVSLTVYPNPGEGLMTVNLSSSTGSQDVAIFTFTSITGQKLMEFHGFTNTEIKLNPDLPSGIYFLAATSNNEQYVEKVVIMR